MKNYPGPRFLLAFLLMLAAGACAGTRGGQGTGEGDERSGVSIEVENTSTPSSDITVYLVSSGGGRSLLGSVPPNRTVTLTYRGNTAGGQYRLLARPTGGREIVSTPFLLGGTRAIRWNLQSNIAVPIE